MIIDNTTLKKENNESLIPESSASLRVESAQSKKANPFFRAGEGVATTLVYDVVGAGDDVGDLPKKQSKIGNDIALNVEERKQTLLNREIKEVRITYSNKKDTESVVLTISDLDAFVAGKKQAKKMLVFILKELLSIYHNGEISKNEVTFSLQDLIDCGLYTSKKRAREGFFDGISVLQKFSIAGYERVRSKKTGEVINETLQNSLINPFQDAFIPKGTSNCVVQLSPNINWKFLLSYFTIIPNIYFQLGIKAGDLLFRAFVYARQNTKAIKAKGCFNVSYRQIQKWLNLPSEDDVREKKKSDFTNYIIFPIRKAISEINKKQNEQAESEDIFIFEPIEDNTGDIVNFLDKSYLKITLKGAYLDEFSHIERLKDDNAKKQIEKAKSTSPAIRQSKSEATTAPNESDVKSLVEKIPKEIRYQLVNDQTVFDDFVDKLENSI